MKRSYVFFICLWIVTAFIVAVVYGKTAQVRADYKRLGLIEYTVGKLDEEYYNKRDLPSDLNTFVGEQDRRKLTYTKTGKQTFILCTTYKTKQTDPYGDNKENETMIKLDEGTWVPSSHPKGQVCYQGESKVYNGITGQYE